MRKVLHLDKQLALGQKLPLPALIGQLLIWKGAIECRLNLIAMSGELFEDGGHAIAWAMQQ